jgi:ubiquinone/menaquinone biosynthesis C-methylase UbiE
VNVFDIAAGHGRYVLDAIAECSEQPASVRLQDYSDVNVAAGRKQIADRRLPPGISFHKADAFDADALAALDPHPISPSSRACTSCFPTMR